MILYINSCIRENSRTDRLAKVLLEKLGGYVEVKRDELNLHPLNKESLENIYVTGIVTKYGTDGRPEGLCSAKKLYYVTTAGTHTIRDIVMSI